MGRRGFLHAATAMVRPVRLQQRVNRRRLRARLVPEGRRLPLLGDDDRTANREVIRHVVEAA